MTQRECKHLETSEGHGIASRRTRSVNKGPGHQPQRIGATGRARRVQCQLSQRLGNTLVDSLLRSTSKNDTRGQSETKIFRASVRRWISVPTTLKIK